MSTVDLLAVLLEEQEDALRAIKIHLSTGEDLSPEELDSIQGLEQRLEETRVYIERVISRSTTSDSFAEVG